MTLFLFGVKHPYRAQPALSAHNTGNASISNVPQSLDASFGGTFSHQGLHEVLPPRLRSPNTFKHPSAYIPLSLWLWTPQSPAVNRMWVWIRFYPVLSRYGQGPTLCLLPFSLYCPNPVATLCHSSRCYCFPLKDLSFPWVFSHICLSQRVTPRRSWTQVVATGRKLCHLCLSTLSFFRFPMAHIWEPLFFM